MEQSEVRYKQKCEPRTEKEKLLMRRLLKICGPSSPSDTDLQQLCHGIELPQMEIDDWMNLIQDLAAQKHWICLAIVLTGCYKAFTTVFNELDTSNWNCENINVGVLLEDLSVKDIQDFGEGLAVALLERGADVETLGHKECPVILYVVRLALRLDTTRLLSYVLKKFANSPEKRDAVDKDGLTVLHVLVKSPMRKRSRYTNEIFDILLRYNCDATIFDNTRRRAIDYVLSDDLSFYNKLSRVSMKTGSVGELMHDHENTKSGENKLLHAKGSDGRSEVTVSNLETFEVSIDAFKRDTHTHRRYDFLADACSILTDIPDGSFSKCYSQLSQLNAMTTKTDWRQVFRRLCKSGKWRSMAYLIYGSTLNVQILQKTITADVLNLEWRGVASTCPTTDLQTNTIMSFLQQCDPVKEACWLDAVLCAVIYRGNLATWNNLAVDVDDCALHAAARFCLLTKRTSLLEHFVSTKWVNKKGGRNYKGETVAHCIIKMSPLLHEDILLRVIDILTNKGLWIFGKNTHGKRAVENLSPRYSRDIFDRFSKFGTIMDEGKKLLRNCEFKLAVDKFSQIVRDVELYALQFKEPVDKNDVVMLYWHRAEAHFLQQSYKDALGDARQCLTYNDEHYKAHMLIGKCCKALHKDDEEAVSAFVKAYTFVESHKEDKIKVEILSEIATVLHDTPFENLPTKQGHVWLKSCYELIHSGDWISAKKAFQQFTLSESNSHEMNYNLEPLCDMSKLIEHGWVLDVMVELLKRGCEKKTLHLNTQDTYSHAVVMMSIKARNVNLLKYVVDHYDDWNVVDRHNGNTLLYVASKEKEVDAKARSDVLTLLLKYGMKADLKNYQRKLASDFLPDDECENIECMLQAKNKGKTTEDIKLKKSKTDDIIHHRMDTLNGEYEKLVSALNQKHTDIESKKIDVSKFIQKLESIPMISVSEIPECLSKIDRDPFQMVAEEMGNLNMWPLLNKLVRKVRKVKKKRRTTESESEKNTEYFYSGFAANMTVLPAVKYNVSEEKKLEIIGTILEGGASLGAENGATALKCAKEARHYNVIAELVRRGANTKHLSMYDGDTPIHAAVVIVLKHLKSCEMLKHLLEVYRRDVDTQQHLNPEQLDVNDECIFHLIAKVKHNQNALKMIKILSEKNISARYRNKKNELPSDIVKQKDLHEHIKKAEGVEPSTEQSLAETSSSKKKKYHDKGSEIIYKRERPVNVIEHVSDLSEKEVRKKRIRNMIERLPDTKNSDANGSENIGGATPIVKEEIMQESFETSENTGSDPVDVIDEEEDKTIVEESGHDQCDDDAFGMAFDKLAWEVECTSDVWKTLRDKHVSSNLKRRIVKEIQTLACGEWQTHSLNKLHHSETSLKLFEIKISKGMRIIWELAVDFSPRLTETVDRSLEENIGDGKKKVCGRRLYSEIIRIWDIVLDHNKIKRSVEKIANAHRRGQTCAIQKRLRGFKTDTEQIARSATMRYPLIYVEGDKLKCESEQPQREMRFYPPGSPNDKEYHILKFYSFSSTLVSHILRNIETKVEFPFRVSEIEHDIINMTSKSPILLLGRSGTGKTTCCLYRLWSKFHAYWTSGRLAGPFLPRASDIVHQDFDNSNQNIDSESTIESNRDDSDASGIGASQESHEHRTDTERQDDHLHQLFVTKNAVLASAVQKNFLELRQADQLMQGQGIREHDLLPNRLQDFEDDACPLFLTSRQLLVLLDASVGPPYFFERKQDGSLKVDVSGWMDLDSPLSLLQVLDTDDSNAIHDVTGPVASGRMNKHNVTLVDPRREVTYTVFAAEIWPRIKTKSEKHHPSLIWTEIMSFIKGSYEALSEHKNKEHYIDIGKKRAPNFTDDRDTICDISERYDKYKRERNMFDETDLVHNVFDRLRKIQKMPWILHQIYVDETQDFTQAELCLLIQLCQNPNEMFMTGDTAQSIMKGVSFRFCDLSSLFHYAKETMRVDGKTSAVEVPKKVHQLTYNYRSHNGILSLATSVLDLIHRFFPGSIDRLQPDQGLFPGPEPILLESCSFADLAVLLRGNQRKTSEIEFGAHQAILVVDDHSKENIPEELRLGLVLTIYEAKGLEFDDVLLYNFFKDSQAVDEWRVVASYLQELSECDENLPVNTGLVMIDQEILSSKHRARPLDFDERRHKVLNSELKLLYTAITRARVNVWIFDENEEKRGPVFEYFKARKLVKSLQIKDIHEASLNENIFPEKSSQSDWVKRGEDCMKRKLYTVAAKCFSMAGDSDKENEALANYRIMAACLQNDDNPKRKREEYFVAAELFLKCNAPIKSALCLKQANEGQLAAEVYERIGQFEKAAGVYTEIKLPLPGSRCYEILENYNKAIQVLVKSKEFKAALDVLKRYKLLIMNLKGKDEPIPQHLIDNAPKETEDALYYKLADWCRTRKDKENMMKYVKKIKQEMQLDFFIKSLYIVEAAKIHEDNGDLTTATRLLCMHGYCCEAVQMSRKTGKAELIAHALLTYSRQLISEVNRRKDYGNTDITKAFLKQCLEEADTLQISCTDIKCQIALLQLELDNDVETMKRRRTIFEDFKNDAGLVEYYNLLFESSIKEESFDRMEVFQSITEGVNCVFRVCKTLQANMAGDKLKKYYEFYGLKSSDREKLILHPKENPICKEMLHGHKGDLEVEIDRNKAHEKIINFLFRRSEKWWDELQEKCQHSNLELPDVEYCMQQKVLQRPFMIDIFLVKIEEYRVRSWNRMWREKIQIGRRNNEYVACKQLLNDLTSLVCHPLFLTSWSETMREIRKDNTIFAYFKQFISERRVYGGNAEETVNAIDDLTLNHVRNDLADSDQRQELSSSMIWRIAKLKNPKALRIQNVYFIKAFDDIINSNHWKSIIHFCMFQLQPGDVYASKIKMYPDLEHLLLWIEFFVSLSFMIIAKLKTQENYDFEFFLPNNYHFLSNVMQTTFKRSQSSLEDMVTNQEPGSQKDVTSNMSLIQRLEDYSVVVSGYSHHAKILRLIVRRCSEDELSFALLERFLILGLTMVCNTGRLVSQDKSSSILFTLKNLQLPDGAPERLKVALNCVKECTVISDVVDVLYRLFEQRKMKEHIIACRWQLGAQPEFLREGLEDYTSSDPTFMDKPLSVTYEEQDSDNHITVETLMSELQQMEEDVADALQDI